MTMLAADVGASAHELHRSVTAGFSGRASVLAPAFRPRARARAQESSNHSAQKKTRPPISGEIGGRIQTHAH
jgi:hypothetical protein